MSTPAVPPKNGAMGASPEARVPERVPLHGEPVPLHQHPERGLAAFAEGAEEALKGHGGLRAKILTDGFLRVS